MVCLYKMMLLRPGLHSLFLGWSRRCGYTAWTDITELRVYRFLECVWKIAINTVASSGKPLMVSNALLQVMRKLFRTTHAFPSAAWTGTHSVYTADELNLLCPLTPQEWPQRSDKLEAPLVLPTLCTNPNEIPTLQHTHARTVLDMCMQAETPRFWLTRSYRFNKTHLRP